ncbi:MAG: HlyD family efflux transporter periplasmic adaptor subunit [Steroidobacteraceae bacterium]
MRAQLVAQTFRAYGQVQSVAVTQVRAVEPGTIERLVLPGELVRSGQVLAALGGAQAQSLLAERRGASYAASIQLAADRRKLTGHLVTRQRVAADQATYEAARGRLQVALQTLTLRAPADGQVLTVDAAGGEQVAAGQLILTLQTGRPWLDATFYGADALAIHPDMSGQFQPIAGGAIPVRVRTVSPALGPDGGEQVGLLAVVPPEGPGARAERWRSGEWGAVRLVGATRPMLAVPTRALILDRAHWWVLVRTARGDRRREVVPGPTAGWMTFISQGLAPGERVVVENAYLEFHRGISRHYTPPD